MTPPDRSITIRNCCALIGTEVITDAVIEITDGLITQISASPPDVDQRLVPSGDGRVWLEANGSVVMPGLINCHTHAAMSLLRGAVEDVPVEAWFKILWRQESKSTWSTGDTLPARIAM